MPSLRYGTAEQRSGDYTHVVAVPTLRCGTAYNMRFAEITKNFFASLRFFVTSQISAPLAVIVGRPKTTDN
ncbi:MAG: hypothetical protein HC892_21615 [Saprospiraceae bacterium]|nr:hypothetical protein [Saprospiraceae bacterium]